MCITQPGGLRAALFIGANMQTPPKKRHRLYVVPDPQITSMDVPNDESSPEFVQVAFDFDSVPDEEEPCARY
jgi:hypothetical protein